MTTHRHTSYANGRQTKEWTAWQNMKRRCYNPGPKDAAYTNIEVCREWQLSFEQFLADVGYAPSLLHSLDRINSSKHYEPGNCRWALPEEQAANKSLYKTSRTGIAGVNHRRAGYRAYAQVNGRQCIIYTGFDFFEACCARKSWEARRGGS